jgi:hypothetical protein
MSRLNENLALWATSVVHREEGYVAIRQRRSLSKLAPPIERDPGPLAGHAALRHQVVVLLTGDRSELG